MNASQSPEGLQDGYAGHDVNPSALPRREIEGDEVLFHLLIFSSNVFPVYHSDAAFSKHASRDFFTPCGKVAPGYPC